MNPVLEYRVGKESFVNRSDGVKTLEEAGKRAVREMKAQLGYACWLNRKRINGKTNCQKNYQRARDAAIAFGADVNNLPKTLGGLLN